MSEILPRLMSADEARDCLDAIRVGTLGVKAKLIELHERRGWEVLGYDSWRACIEDQLQIGKSHAYRLLNAAYIAQEISPIGENVTESQARELKKAPKEKRVETLAKAKDTAAAQGRAKPTAMDIKEAVEQGSGKKPPHEAPRQDVEEARKPAMDGDDGPCPKGGEHELIRDDGDTFCAKCFEPLQEVVIDDLAGLQGDYDTTSLDEFCQWTIDQCATCHREQLAQRLKFWAHEAKG